MCAPAVAAGRAERAAAAPSPPPRAPGGASFRESADRALRHLRARAAHVRRAPRARARLQVAPAARPPRRRPLVRFGRLHQLQRARPHRSHGRQGRGALARRLHRALIARSAARCASACLVKYVN